MKSFINVLKGKSRTINFNALFLALFGVARACGFEIPEDLAVALQGLLNIGLRTITSKSLSEK